MKIMGIFRKVVAAVLLSFSMIIMNYQRGHGVILERFVGRIGELFPRMFADIPETLATTSNHICSNDISETEVNPTQIYDRLP